MLKALFFWKSEKLAWKSGPIPVLRRNFLEVREGMHRGVEMKKPQPGMAGARCELREVLATDL
jgi:hypothetical protein